MPADLAVVLEPLDEKATMDQHEDPSAATRRRLQRPCGNRELLTVPRLLAVALIAACATKQPERSAGVGSTTGSPALVTALAMRALTADMAKRELRPYFLWDEDVSIDELHQILAPVPIAHGATSSWRRCCAKRVTSMSGTSYAPQKWRACWITCDVGSVAGMLSGRS